MGVENYIKIFEGYKSRLCFFNTVYKFGLIMILFYNLWFSTTYIHKICDLYIPYLLFFVLTECRQFSKLVHDRIYAMPLLPKVHPIVMEYKRCVKPNPLVVGGQNATSGEYPHMVKYCFFLHWKNSVLHSKKWIKTIKYAYL